MGARAEPRWPAALSLVLFFVGAGLCSSFIQSVFHPVFVLLVAALLTALWWLARAVPARPVVRALGRLARAAMVAIHVFWIYLVVTWGTLLAWSTPWWIRAGVAALLAASVATWRRPPGRFRVPVALPMGVWITACLGGWLREEGFARCDDYRRLTAQAGPVAALPTRPELRSCRAGDVLPIGRYPRKTWESPDGSRYVVSTQEGKRFDALSPPPGAFDGLFCEVSAATLAAPRCLGGLDGKAHAFVDAPSLGQLFMFAWSLPGHGGHQDSAVFRAPRQGPLAILQEHRFDGSFGDGFYEPTHDELYVVGDACGPIRSIKGSDFSPLPHAGPDTCWGEVHYHQARDEGVWCGGAEAVVAFRANPFSERVLAGMGGSSGRAFLSWGCDWDPEGRKVYAAIPNLGLLATLDYDTGRIERQVFVGFGMRSVAFDAPRRRVYVTEFLGGDVLALDADSGREVRRWFAGRFVREVRLTRDGKAILATSNLGLLRIPLEP